MCGIVGAYSFNNNNFKITKPYITALSIAGAATKSIQSKTMDKGQKQELEMFAKAIKQGEEWAIPLWQQVQAMEIAFEVEEQFMI